MPGGLRLGPLTRRGSSAIKGASTLVHWPAQQRSSREPLLLLGIRGRRACTVTHVLQEPPAAAPSARSNGAPTDGSGSGSQPSEPPSHRVATSSPPPPVPGANGSSSRTGSKQKRPGSRSKQPQAPPHDSGDTHQTLVSCDEEAGGCNAPWQHDSDLVARPTAVRAALLETDPGLNQNLMSSATTISQLFNQDLWERHRSANRYWLNIQRMPQSTVLRRIFRPCLVFSCISAAVCAVNSLLPTPWAVKVCMPLVPHTLLGAALSLLLVFRTNSSFARFTEGRMLWGCLIRCSRDWVRLAANYLTGDLRDRAAQYVQVLAFTLKAHLRKGRTRADPNDPTAFRDDPSQVVQELLPPDEAAEVLAQPNRPFYVICKMTALSREMAQCGAPRHVLLTVERVLSEMLGVIGGCDRILGTPIPLSYTRHTARSLVLFLATLPLALWPVLGWISVPSMFFISFIFLGIDEIGVEIEEPFCILPLLPLCKTIVGDVEMAMAMARRTA